jgi:SNF2 family DNA or RNA helicase
MDKLALYKHQRNGIEFAIRNGQCALFHDPGLGKTRTCLEIFSHYRAYQPSLMLFVVCPLSLVNSAWGEDIKRFTNFSYTPFKELKDKLPDIVIINYEALISKRYLPAVLRFIQSHNCMCVLDESSRLKNNKSVTTKTLLRLAEDFKYRIIASGTPMPNSELELWGQVRFIRPDVLHSSFYAFRNTYFHLERNGRAMRMSGQYMTKETMREILSSGWRYVISLENRKRLMDEINPFTHWVKKKDALDLPEKVDEVREIILNAKEQKAYDEMKDFLVTEIEGTEIAVQVALAKLMKLRQATAGFFYSETGEVVEIGNATKLKELEEILEELGDQPVIIWVQFHQEVEAIHRLISQKYGADKVATLYSKTKDKDGSINKFKTNQVRYLIAHPKSAGHGLTFTNCSTVVFYSLDYSYEAHIQARDRIHRIGQKNSCLYIYIIAKDTIDEELLKVLQRKQTLQDTVYAIVRNATKKQSYPVRKKAVSGGVGL